MEKDKYIGRLLGGRYEILEVLGTGGMAVVYKARCHRLNRLVAVKILKDEFSQDEEFRRRFQAESQAVAMLSHPNIVSVYDVSTSEEGDHIVMELIDGISLKQYMEKKGVLNWKETLHFAMQIAKALEHAHSRGIVHRDIKPHNVMVLKNGSVKVMDFGIAQVTARSSTVTKEALGSVHYISPEQAKGGRVDNRSDIYSLGIVMYEMIAGRVPFDGDTPVSVAISHINSGAQKPSVFNPNTPVGLEQIIMKSLSKAPQDRYPTATAMLYDMDEFRKDPTKEFPEVKGTEEVTRTVATEVTQKTMVAPVRTIAQRTVAEKTERHKPRKEREQEKNRGLGPTIAVACCALVGVVAIIIVLVIWSQGGFDTKPSMVTVPGLVGQSFDSLQEYDGIEVVCQRNEYDDTYGEGLIIYQSPESGTEVVHGTKVFVIVSLGNQIPGGTMEALSGYPAEEAQLYLDGMDLGLKVRLYDEYSDTVDPGVVVRTNPEKGKPLKQGQTVELYVSIGPEVRTERVPNVIGQNVDTAQRNLTLLGFKNVDTKEVDSDQPAGVVVDQTPGADARVDVNRKIILSVSKGPAKPEETEPTQPEETTKEHSFALPDMPEEFLLSILWEDQWLAEDVKLAAHTAEYKLQLTGMGAEEYSIYINGEYIDTVTVEF